MYPLKIAAIAAAASLAMGTAVACGSSSGASHTTTPAVCSRQYGDWRNGPQGVPVDYLQKELHTVALAMLAVDLRAIRVWLIKIGPTAQIVQTYPMPRCADPAGYWRKYLADARAGSRIARTGSNNRRTIVHALSAMKPLKPLGVKLAAELSRTARVKPWKLPTRILHPAGLGG